MERRCRPAGGEQLAEMPSHQGQLSGIHRWHIRRPRALKIVAFLHDHQAGGHPAHDAEKAPGLKALSPHPLRRLLGKKKVRFAIGVDHGMGFFAIFAGPCAEAGQKIHKCGYLSLCYRRLSVIYRPSIWQSCGSGALVCHGSRGGLFDCFGGNPVNVAARAALLGDWHPTGFPRAGSAWGAPQQEYLGHTENQSGLKSAGYGRTKMTQYCTALNLESLSILWKDST